MTENLLKKKRPNFWPD